MRALTIKQPWADLIVNGIKDIENRTWRTKFRGRVYIHASASNAFDNKDASGIISYDAWNTCSVNARNHLSHGIWKKSAIIGEVDIVDCVLNHPSVWAQHVADKKLKDGTIIQVPVYNWVLANPVLYDKPITNIKGKLSFWEFNPDLITKG